MLPSSSNKICCNEQTCPKRNRKPEDATTASSGVEKMRQEIGVDKETQNSPVAASPSAQTLIPTKTSEKSTEAYFDRNNENISSNLNKFCPSNSSKITTTQSQMLAAMLKCHLAPTTPIESQSSWHQSQQLPIRDLSIFHCKKINITPSSSCSSLSCANAPKEECLQRTPIKKTNNSHDEATPDSFLTKHPKKPGRALQYRKKVSAAFGRPAKYYNLENIAAAYEEEQFYSCASTDSEEDEISENFFHSQNHYNTNKNDVIAQLLQEVDNLINEDDRIRKKLETKLKQSSRKKKETTTQAAKVKQSSNLQMSKQTSTTQLDDQLLPPPPPSLPSPRFFCNCRAYVPDNNFSFFPSFNLVNPAALSGTQIPEPLVYEEKASLKMASSGNRNTSTAADQLADNLSGICFAAEDPLAYNIKTQCSALAAVNNIKMEAASTQINENSSLKEVKDTQSDAFNEHSLCADVDSFKDCWSSENSLPTAQDHQLTAAKFICKCVCHQLFLEFHDQTLTISCFPAADLKCNESSSLTMKQPPSLKANTLEGQASLEIDKEFLDEELLCRCVEFDKSNGAAVLETFSDEIDVATSNELPPSEVYQPCLDCLMEYDDEEPNFKNTIATKEDINQGISDIGYLAEPGLIVDLDLKPAEPIEVGQTPGLEMLPQPMELAVAELEADRDDNAIPYKEHVEPEQLSEANAELEILSFKKESAFSEAEKPVDKSEQGGADLTLKKETTSSFIAPNIYNFLPDLDTSHDSKQLITNNEYNDEEDHELAKEKLSESFKEDKPDEDHISHDKEMTLTALKLTEAVGGGSTEMKFFIDSLILDMEAMDYARCYRSQFKKKLRQSKKLVHCIRDSFPVTITDVTSLTANSLYVKWQIHDCFGIAGYEIFTDGYLTNRFYNSRHVAAVITQVDVTLPHRIALVAQPENHDENFDDICKMSQKSNNLKSLACKRAGESQRQSNAAALWTPSIFLYDPSSERAFSTSSALESNEI